MIFRKIDHSTWSREEYFNHYFSDTPCTYSMTLELDITRLRQLKLNLYPTMLYIITTVVNQHEEFRTAFDSNGNVGIYDQLMPCYTVFHNTSETFSNIWTVYSEDFLSFCENYKNDIDEYGSVERMTPKPNMPENTFPISMIPWTSFHGFNLNLQKGYDYLLPIFTMGKFQFIHKRCLLPISIQVHHGVCDGFHLCRFINEVQNMIDGFSFN